MRTASYASSEVARMVKAPETRVIAWINSGFVRATWDDLTQKWSLPPTELPVARALAVGKTPDEARATIRDIEERLAARTAVLKPTYELERLQNHLGEEHGPLGRFPFATGTAWYELEALSAAHRRIHAEHPCTHTHKDMA